MPLLVFLQLAGYRCAHKNGTDANATATTTTSQPAQPAPVVSAAAGTADFVAASKAVMPAVVHVNVLFNAYAPYGASGSGVILSADGYIATNNHVVENAAAIEIILPDKRRYPAKLVGRDSNTDLALVKVEAQNLLVVALGNSDSVQIGEWVLAVGFPLSLNTTVTAGIVSAKARSGGIIGI